PVLGKQTYGSYLLLIQMLSLIAPCGTPRRCCSEDSQQFVILEEPTPLCETPLKNTSLLDHACSSRVGPCRKQVAMEISELCIKLMNTSAVPVTLPISLVFVMVFLLHWKLQEMN